MPHLKWGRLCEISSIFLSFPNIVVINYICVKKKRIILKPLLDLFTFLFIFVCISVSLCVSVCHADVGAYTGQWPLSSQN